MNVSGKKSGAKNLIIIVVVIIAAWQGYTHFFSGQAGGKQKDSKPGAHVSVAAVKRDDVPMQLQLIGTVIANETVVIKSRLDSQIVSVLFRDGDNVKEGQVLFELDDRSLKAQLNQLEANLQRDKAQLENARLQYERAKKLVEGSAVAQSRVDETKAAYEAQKAAVSASQANIDNTQVQLSYCKITAPISGRAGTINVTRGNNVKANDVQALVTINQVQPIRVQFAIPQKHYDKVRSALTKGDVEIEVARSGAPDSARGKLEYIDNNIDASSGTFTARATYANEDEKLWPGMFVNVNVALGVESGVPVIPVVAIQGEESARFVFVVDKDGKKALKKPVTVSRMTEQLAIISSGLEDGEQVITDGLLRVNDGAAIEISKPEKPEEKPVARTEDAPTKKVTE